jgi:hypothetical protein
MAAIVALGGSGAALAGDLKDEVKVQIETAALAQHMKPGTYVCAAGHFHIKGSVQNLASVPVGQIMVAGKVFDADGNLLDTATASTRQPVLNPNDKAPINLEFLKVTGPLIQKVKNQELTVVAVAPKP